MDGVKIQSVIYKGYAKASNIIGLPYNQYRPTTANNPLAAQNRIANIKVSLNAMDMKYGKPNLYGKALWYGIFDGTATQPGDYLTNGSNTYFIAGQQPLLPIVVVECNRTASIFRPQVQSGSGIQPYGGNTASTQTALMTGWPCSILQGTKGEKSETGLPGDTRSSWWSILLPYAGVQIKPDDVITDDIGLRYVISSPELTDLGWRITAMMAVA